MNSIMLDGKEFEIDDECFDLVKYFNEIGLKTISCCSGHNKQNFRIIFDNSISDDDISKFLNDKVNKYNHSIFLGKFVKWARVYSGKIVLSWMYEAEKIGFAKVDFKRLKQYDDIINL